MDEATYKIWWPLHLKKVLGETLLPQEMTVYEAGLQQLYAEENLEGNLKTLQEERQKTQELRSEYLRIHQQFEEMEATITTLEARLGASNKHALSVGS